MSVEHVVRFYLMYLSLTDMNKTTGDRGVVSQFFCLSPVCKRLT